MATISVALFPVGLFPLDGENLQLMVYSPDEPLIASRPASNDELSGVAAGLWNALGDTGVTLNAEPVGFVNSNDGLVLIFTAVVPMVSTFAGIDPEGPSQSPPADWVRLCPSSGAGKPSLDRASAHAMVLNYWRRQLEETTAAFEFLPRFFTTPQVRAIYSSVWGEDQNAGSFHRWLHANNPSARTPAPPEQVRKQVDQQVAAVVKGTAIGIALRDASKLLSKGSVGATPFAVGALVPMAAAFPMILPALGAAAGLIAYQSRVAPGPQPDWYRSAHARRVLLADPYPPRPKWLNPGTPTQHFH